MWRLTLQDADEWFSLSHPMGEGRGEGLSHGLAHLEEALAMRIIGRVEEWSGRIKPSIDVDVIFAFCNKLVCSQARAFDVTHSYRRTQSVAVCPRGSTAYGDIISQNR